ncbi:fused signal recognition particle receptor [Anaerosolibacter carboniphilus]|uniref:Signal recognition particle receptor FtsY n=1 Tax=Anaerosolibacter carboniphilus TaxID=1417629 RepID=A0A841L681_9FIRM|nr:signal recognition particle-docking protein FtsY [Anaerosolibacter carboniphilus]MBB6217805.1 fused signal recognition particle receptor [Anaerosolibacter carboniphilus]
MFKKLISKFKKEHHEEQGNIQEEESLDEMIELEGETDEEAEEGFDEDTAYFEDDEVASFDAETWDEVEADPDMFDDQDQPEIEAALEIEKVGFFARLKEGLTKTRQGITARVDQVLKSYKKVDEELLEEIEEILITADVGVNTTMEIIGKLRNQAKERKITEVENLRGLLKEILADTLDLNKSHELNIQPLPAIILVVGVNGVGKTTSIGKIAHRMRSQGKKVLLAAGDTFRAAAIDQLEIWGNRVGVDVIKHQEGSDPAAVVFDAIQAAKARKIDVLICDTAGRLHNKTNLMNELGKVRKVVEREYGEASKEILLVLDATTGQNAIQQAKIFKEAVDVSGIVLTKLDGTAKGGVVLGISSELDIPVKLIGVGEGMNDLQEFKPNDFVNALFGDE